MYELLQGHWKRGQLLRQKKLFRESFSAFLEGYWKGDGTVSEKYNILVEVVASFSNITGFIFFCLGFEDRINCVSYFIYEYPYVYTRHLASYYCYIKFIVLFLNLWLSSADSFFLNHKNNLLSTVMKTDTTDTK